MVKSLNTPKPSEVKRTKAIKKDNLQVVEVSDIPDALFTIVPSNLFEALIFPLSKSEFYNTIFRKQALVIRSPVTRLTRVKQSLFNLNLNKML